MDTKKTASFFKNYKKELKINVFRFKQIVHFLNQLMKQFNLEEINIILKCK
jgi:hypothetical protein